MSSQTTTTARPASEKQIGFLQTLLRDRECPQENAERLRGMIDRGELPSWLASKSIEWLLAQPRVQAPEGQGKRGSGQMASGLTPGVYENDEGIFVVKPNRQKTRLYAKKLVELEGAAERLTEDDERVQIEFEYAPGAIYRLEPEDRMPADRAKQLTIRYGRCINCGRRLKAAQSVERGIGPVCIKAFA